MSNICFLIGNIGLSGGTERVTSIVANGLSDKGYNVSILSLVSENAPFFDIDSSIDLDSIYSERVSLSLNFFKTVSKLRKFIIRKNINTLIVVDSISCVFSVPALFGLKIKHICWEHFNFNNNNGVKFRDYGRKLAAKYCDYVVTLTKRDKELWEQGIKNIKTKIIPIANPSPFKVQENIPSLDYKTILCVGRLTHVKGFDLLITAWTKIAQQLPEWKIVIVGSGEDEMLLKQMTKDLGVDDSIIFAGQQKNMDRFYREASFFCMTSRFEGLPMVLLEAQSYGLPIVAFDCDTGPAEIVVEGTGFLVKPNEITDFSNRMLQLTCMSVEDYNNLCLNAKINNQHYSLKNIINKWVVGVA